jgi:hypothetical protein
MSLLSRLPLLLCYVVALVVIISPLTTGLDCGDCVWNPIPSTGTLVTNRYLPTMTVDSINELIYLYGGSGRDSLTGEVTLFYELFEFNITTQTWRRIYYNTDIDPQNYQGQIVALNGDVYLMGGQQQIIRDNVNIWKYDRTWKFWSTLYLPLGRLQLHYPLRTLVKASEEEVVHVYFRSEDNVSFKFSGVWSFNITNGEWNVLSNGTFDHLFVTQVESPFALAYVDDKIIIGVFMEKETQFVEFDRTTQTWRLVEVEPIAKMPVLRFNMDSCSYSQNGYTLLLFEYKAGTNSRLHTFDLSKVSQNIINYENHGFNQGLFRNQPYMAVHGIEVYLFDFPVSILYQISNS